MMNDDARAHCQGEEGDLIDIDNSTTVGLLLTNFYGENSYIIIFYLVITYRHRSKL